MQLNQRKELQNKLVTFSLHVTFTYTDTPDEKILYTLVKSDLS